MKALYISSLSIRYLEFCEKYPLRSCLFYTPFQSLESTRIFYNTKKKVQKNINSCKYTTITRIYNNNEPEESWVRKAKKNLRKKSIIGHIIRFSLRGVGIVVCVETPIHVSDVEPLNFVLEKWKKCYMTILGEIEFCARVNPLSQVIAFRVRNLISTLTKIVSEQTETIFKV